MAALDEAPAPAARVVMELPITNGEVETDRVVVTFDGRWYEVTDARGCARSTTAALAFQQALDWAAWPVRVTRRSDTTRTVRRFRA